MINEGEIQIIGANDGTTNGGESVNVNEDTQTSPAALSPEIMQPMMREDIHPVSEDEGRIMDYAGMSPGEESQHASKSVMGGELSQSHEDQLAKQAAAMQQLEQAMAAARSGDNGEDILPTGASTDLKPEFAPRPIKSVSEKTPLLARLFAGLKESFGNLLRNPLQWAKDRISTLFAKKEPPIVSKYTVRAIKQGSNPVSLQSPSSTPQSA